MNLSSHPDGYYCERERWYFRANGSVMGPFGDKAEAQMAVLYFRQRLKWPSVRELHEFMGREARRSA